MVPFRSKSQKNIVRNAGKRSTKRKKTSRPWTKLAFETLEPRTLLAADLTLAAADFAEITGVVRNDLQGDGNGANDTVVVGASAKLFLDGGNGLFGGDDLQVGSAQTTGADGRYLFSGIGAGKYFVKIDPPSDLHFRPGQDVREVNITPAEADGSVGTTIDGFTSTQIVRASPPLPASDVSTQLDSAVLGGERDMFVQLTNGADPFSSVSLISAKDENGKGLLRLASDTTVTGNATIVWDGADSNSPAIDYTGLGGVDLTEHNGNTMTGISLTVGADHPNAKVKLKVYTNAGNWSEYLTTVPETPGGAATQHVNFRFADLAASQSGQGADFQNVGAIELTFEGVSAVDGQVSLVGLVGLTTKQADFTALPRMSLGDLVWIDSDNDGLHESGEQGAAGVKLNLYEDVDENNQYTAGVDTLLGMTTTDGSGNYLFENLFPGKYVVQVDPLNFESGGPQAPGPLAGLRTSTGNDPAADPDNDQNNDDNGTAVAGAGVVSQAVALSGNTEPTSDGDSDSNSNRTVDFGFFGFDLVLDKSIEQTSVAPTETINYTVLVINDGPSTAFNVQFTDTLPGGVTFQSGNTNRSGVGVSHTGGPLSGSTVTASLGTMLSGDSVIVTIVGVVNSNATGTLVNTATVSAPNELNLSNNTDTVSIPVTPRIDLAIEKSDSDDPVEPGDSFSYTLEIVNNGPSEATGVTITDVLPSTGVAFLSASRTPASVTGDTVVFNIGDLASGETASVTINVKVDDNFVGTLLNHSEVQGNETETNLNNNEDDEPTLVNIDPASLAGSVFVDRNDNGVFDPSEQPLPNVTVELTGIDFAGATVVLTTLTETDGSYLFDNLNPGSYRVVEVQPGAYQDGKDHLGTHGGAHGENPGTLLIPNDVNPAQIQDLFLGIELGGGDAAELYDFGELAVTVSKADFIGPLVPGMTFFQ